MMCRLLGVSPAGFYAHRRRRPAARAIGDALLRLDIERLYRDNHRRYGSPRMHQDLRAEGKRHGVKRVARLMREQGLRARSPRRFVRTTQTDPQLLAAPNLVQHRFQVDQPNRVWVSDITYLPTSDGWLSLAVVLDLFSRRVIGWQVSDTLEQHLVSDAVRHAFEQRRPGAGAILHSDRGRQYLAGPVQQLLARHQAKASMSAVGRELLRDAEDGTGETRDVADARPSQDRHRRVHRKLV